MKKNLSVKNWFSSIISESEDKKLETPKITSNNVNFVSDVKIRPDRNLMIIHFVTLDEKAIELKLKDSNFYNWIKSNKNIDSENILIEFVKFFLENHQPTEKVMSEIVDEYNGLIGDKDLPRNSDRIIGLSSKDSSQAVYQTRAKGWNNFNSGAISGFISW